MTVKGMPNCPHCQALLQGSICNICGKSERDPVEVVEAPPPPSRWATDLDRNQLGVLVTVVLVVIVGALGVWLYMNREAVQPAPAALPAPTDTIIRAEFDAPSTERSEDIPVVTVAPVEVTGAEEGAARDVGSVSSPWDEAPPISVVTGELLDLVEYDTGIERVAELVAAVNLPFELAPPAVTTSGAIEVAAAETNQPFAARSLADNGIVFADVWIMAGGDDASDAYLLAAKTKWSAGEPLDSYSPGPGIRLSLIVDDGTNALWVRHATDHLVLLWVTSGSDPVPLATFVGQLH